jgi:hypothetical protein
VSVKIFLGRFDMRTMQAATASSMADSFNDTPAEGAAARCALGCGAAGRLHAAGCGLQG